MFRKKKKEKQPEKTEVIKAEAIDKDIKRPEIPAEIKEELDDLAAEFNSTYNLLTSAEQYVRPEMAVQINLLFAIYGELREMRRMLKE